MELWSLAGIVLAVFIGSYVQAVAGFAMGMIVVAVAGGFGWLDLPTLAIVVSLLSLINTVLALYGRTADVNWRLFRYLVLGQVPGIYAGLTLLLWMDGHTRWLLELCLGLFVLFGAVSMLLKPHPWQRQASAPVAVAAGLSGGMVGGMFSASGPVLGWFGYSQPMPLAQIRATLLSCFAVTTGARTVMVGVNGDLTLQVLEFAALCAPVVVLGTWLGRRFEAPVSEQTIKRAAQVLLLAMGIWICAGVMLRG